MFGSIPANKALLALFALSTISNALILDAAHAQSSKATAPSRTEISRIVRGLSALRLTVDGLSKQVSGIKPTVVTAPAPSPTPVAVAAPVQAPIGKNQPTNGWVSFDFYPGRSGQAISYHNATGIGVAFRITEGGKVVQEYKLDYPYAERTADQKNGDSFMIQNCISEFRQVSNTDGGSFFILASSDPKLGLNCSSTKN